MSEQSSTSTHLAVPALTLGWRLQMALSHAGMTTQEMADEIGVTRSTISRWVNDHGAPPRPGFVKLWALRCGVPHIWLAEGIAPSDSPPDQGIAASTCIPTTSSVTAISERRRNLRSLDVAA